MKILYAVSGGIDSMCMADMFCRAEDGDAVAHCNFHLRGEESDADAELVRGWAEKHGVEFFHADFDTEGFASSRGISIEMAARDLRYDWFARTARKHGFDAVAVAHNANDNAETFFLNLLRGTGGRGLRGMQAEGVIPGTDVPLFRPLLSMSRARIEAYAAEHGVEYREDRTNAETVYKRNMLRHKVLPVLKEINPSYLDTLGRDMRHIAQENDIAEEYYLNARGNILSGDRISVPALLSYSHWRYLLYRLTETYSLSEETLEALISHIGGSGCTFSGKVFESPTHTLITAAGAVIIRKRGSAANSDEALVIEAPGRYHFHGREILVESFDSAAGLSLRQPAEVTLADGCVLRFPFTLRGWKEGDWMRPFGMKGRRKKVSDLFTDLKLSIPEKRESIVLHSDHEPDASHVLAVLGYRTDEALRITEGSTGNILKITLI